jgi:hypothetical protein
LPQKNKIKMNLQNLQILKENPFEAFVLDNIYLIVAFISITLFGYYSNKYYINLKNICPKCDSVDISRIKKNKLFKMIGLDDVTMKFNCRKCNNKFYVLGNNREKKVKV